MKIRTFAYFVKEAVKSMFRNGLMTLASIGAVAAALLVLGCFIIITLNINYIVSDIESQVEITAYLNDSLESDQINDIGREIIQIKGVKEVVFVSKAQALEEFKERLKEHKNILIGLEEDNPLPDSYRIKVLTPEDVGFVAEKVSIIKGVAEVKYAKEVVDKLFTVTRWIRIIALGFMTIFTLVAVFIISNTIKITVFARRKEINIMKYIGATDWFIRWPFFIEGMLMGFIGASIAIGILMGGYYYLLKVLYTHIRIIKLLPIKYFYDYAGYMALAGAIIGSLGSTISIRKFLKV